MKHDAYGKCDACNKPLKARHHTFNKHVEQCFYGQPESDDGIVCQVLSADTLAAYCSAECAWPAVLADLSSRNLSYTGGCLGPIGVCAKCGGPVLMTGPHVSYNIYDETLERKPWLTSINVHCSEGLAEVCVNCDGDVEADSRNLAEPEEIESPVVLVKERALPV